MKPIKQILDDIAYKIVDLRAGNKCELCGEKYNLSHHHLYGRGLSIRWNTKAIMLICTFNPKCRFNHEEAEKNRKAFQALYGSVELKELSKKIIYDCDYKQIKKDLETYLTEMQRS
jgi:hypothetical protein